MNWEKVKLGDISANIQTGPFGSQLHQYDYSETGTPVVMPKDLIDGKISEQSIARVSQDHVQRLNRHIIQTGDILYSRRGDVGRCAFATEHEKGWLCGTGCLRVTTDVTIADSKFVFYQLQQPEVVGWVEKHAVGATMLNLNTTILSNIPLLLPPIETQRQIADILSTYDDLIENNRKQIKLLEEAAQRLYKEWFVDLRFPGHEHTKIVDGVPDGWEKSTVSNISSILRRGISPKYNDQAELMVINQKCIRQTVVTFDEARRQEKLFPEGMNLQDSDTVICSTGAGTLGRVGQIFGNYPQTTFDSHVTLVRAKSGFGKQYLFHFLKYCQSYLMGMGKGSTNQLELSRRTIQDLEILIPLEEIGQMFESLVQSIHDKISAVNAEIDRLQSARDRLLPKLMSGEVEV